MAGRFNGLNRSHWNMLKPLFPPSSKMGRPGASRKKVFNSILWILITGARWCDLPKGRQWAARSTAHRWLGRLEEDGTLGILLYRLRDNAEISGLLNLERLSADSFFSGGKGGGEIVDYGYKGKGVTTHLLVDGSGTPLCFEVTGGDERQQVEKLVVSIEEKISRLYQVYRLIPILEADKDTIPMS